MPQLGQDYRSQTFNLQNATTWTSLQITDIHSVECHNLDKSTDLRHSFCRMPRLGQDLRHSFCRMPQLGQEYRSQTFILQNATTWTRVQTSDIHSAECHNLDKSTEHRHSFCRMPQLGQEYRSQTFILRAVDELKSRTQHSYCRKTPTFLCLCSIRLSGRGFTLLQFADGSLAKK